MKKAVTALRIREGSPRFKARMTGSLFLLTIVAGIIAEMFISDQLVVSSNAAATAANILANKSLFEAGLGIYLIEMVCNIAITVLFYELLKPVNRSLSLLSAVFSLVGCVIKTFSRVFYIAPLIVLSGSPYLSVFDADQLHALALVFLKVNAQGAGISLVFFGFSTLLQGYLILKSTFLPRILGVLSILGGLGWVLFLYPPLGNQLFLPIVAIGLLGSVLQIGWFLAVGVNEQRWYEQAAGISVPGARSALATT